MLFIFLNLFNQYYTDIETKTFYCLAVGMAEAEPRGRGRGRGGPPRGRGRGGFGMKRPMPEANEYDEFSGGFSKKRKIMDDVYRFVVREDLVKVVIGKGGMHIREIKEEAKEQGIDTKVSVYAQCSNGAPLMDGASDRVMSVQTSTDGLTMALNHLIYSVQTHHNHKGAKNFGQEKRQKLELRLLVPAYCCSAIIGKGGSVIQKIKEETASYIQVYTLPMPESEEHCVRIQNFEEGDLVATAVKVFEAIADIKGKTPITMYDPIYFEHGEYGDTGSYIDTEWYQDALRSRVAKPTTFRDLRGGAPPRGGAPRGRGGAPRGRGAAHVDPYAEDPYAEGPYAEEAAYDESGYGYEAEYGNEESFYPAPRARGRGAPRGYAARGAPVRGRGGRGGPRGAPPGRGAGRGGAPMRSFPSRGGFGRGAPRGRAASHAFPEEYPAEY